MLYEQAKDLLAENGQLQVLRFWDRLDEEERDGLLGQVSKLDFAGISRMKGLLLQEDDAITGEFEPAEVVELKDEDAGEARAAGEELLKKGQVGVILVAGGQGSRLGFDGPKGAFPVGPVSDVPLFHIHCRKILALERKYECEIPFYIMTSDVNDVATRAFFDEHDYFGLDRARVKFFVQGMWPALSEDGKVMMDRPDHLFMSPDGHGGTLSALSQNGMLDDMQARGLRVVFYFQVDNPLVEIADPAFVGLHVGKGSDVSTKVCAKKDAGEGLGVVVCRDGRDAVVEYTELTEEQKNERLADGQLKFLYGSVAIHLFSVDFMMEQARAELPLHVAHKKVPYCDENGETIKPDAPNAVKFEKFIFDVIPRAEVTMNMAFDRSREFSPVKNASGNDSPESAKRDMVEKYARWLERCGVRVPRDAEGLSAYKIEIDPCFAADAGELRERLGRGFEVTGDVLLEDCGEEC